MDSNETLDFQKSYQFYKEKYEKFKSMNFNLDMSRGKPCSEQLDLSNELLSIVKKPSDCISKSNIDCRNYGANDGIEEIKEFISSVTGIEKENFIVGGNSSLSMMFDTISCFMIHGAGGEKPWAKQEKIKFLCPAPGYDRHFSMCEYFGIEMITVPMTPQGPDMEIVEKLITEDSSIKGMWCVPKYSNPEGIVYSDETVKRLANLKPAAKDFRLFWDNAYFVHDLTENPPKLLDIFSECKKAGNEELPIIFYSTSKITFAGAGIAFLACGKENLAKLKKNYSFKTVGFNKLNQIRHVKFLKDKETLKKHMEKQKSIIWPKFEKVLSILKENFGENEILTWNKPKGGYFVSVNTISGCAKEVVKLCREAGLKLTDAGATFPYKKDPFDRNIRLAPTYPPLEELEKAMNLFCIVVKMVYFKSKIS